MMTDDLLTNELIERIRLLKAEIDALQFQLNKAETELFFIQNPECRPK